MEIQTERRCSTSSTSSLKSSRDKCLAGPGEQAADFEIQAADTHGVDGLISLFGIASPGLTASLAIAEYVYQKLLT